MRRVVRPSLILIAVLLAGCLDRIFGPRKKKADYAIDCEPALVTLPRGSAGTVSCTVTSKNGFANEVGLSASNLPAGVTMVFGSASVKPPKNGSTTVWAQVAIGNSVNPSTNPWTVVGSSGGTTHSWNGSLGVVEKTATVHLVYLVPSDRQQRDDFARRMEGAIRHAQIWYLNTLGNGKTFAISHPSVAIYKTPHPASWYSTNNPGDASVFRFSNNVQADGLPLAGARVDDPDNVWVLYIDAPAGAGQAPGSGGRGIAVIDGTWLARLGQKDAAGNCPAVGILAHELGHAFANLADLPDCGTGGIICPPYPVMGNGSGRYPDAALRPEEKEALNARRVFLPLRLSTKLFDCSQLSSADLGSQSVSANVAPNGPLYRCMTPE